MVLPWHAALKCGQVKFWVKFNIVKLKPKASSWTPLPYLYFSQRHQELLLHKMSGMGRVLKIVAVGDGAVGKTSLLLAYTQGVFDPQYIPTVFENYAGDIELDGKKIQLHIMGHRWPRGLWQMQGSMLPRGKCIPGMFQHRQPELLRERSPGLAARSTKGMWRHCSYPPGWYKIRPTKLLAGDQYCEGCRREEGCQVTQNGRVRRMFG